MTRRPVAVIDISAADYDDLDATVEAIMAAIVERSTAAQLEEEHLDVDESREGRLRPP